MQQHFAARIGRMSLEEYRTRVESVRDPVVVQQWLDKMKKVTRYTWKVPPATPPAVPATPADPVSPEPAAEVPAISFDSLEDARAHLLSNARDQLVRQVPNLRIHGRTLETLPQGEIRRAVEGELERQRRFPLDTANALRGRLRREHFTIFKKGAKGVSYVCAVKRKFRVPGQSFSENIGALISYVEGNPMVKAGDLLRQFLGLPPAVDSAPPAQADAPAPPQELTAEQREKRLRVQADLLWLVREGYVTEFIDGSLYASPPVVEARRGEVEAAEVDPENFPEVPVVQAESPVEAASAPLPEALADEPASAPEAAPSEEPPAPPEPC
jgi:hypothetical protein